MVRRLRATKFRFLKCWYNIRAKLQNKLSRCSEVLVGHRLSDTRTRWRHMVMNFGFQSAQCLGYGLNYTSSNMGRNICFIFTVMSTESLRQLNPWGRVLTEKLIVIQHFTEFTRTRHWTQMNPIPKLISYFFTTHFNIILPPTPTPLKLVSVYNCVWILGN